MNDNETIADIIAEMRFHGQLNIDAEKDKPEYGILTVEGRITKSYADRLESAHKREVDALKQRCTELNAEVAAKDEVIKRLNDAISEEQRHKMTTAENSSAVGNAAKLRETLCEILSYIESFHKYIAPRKGKRLTALFAVADTILSKARAALAAPPRNCDAHTADELKAIFKSELVSELPIANEHEKNLVTITAMGVIDTLFALATEKEGGAK